MIGARHVILGGGGFIGRHVARALLARGDCVVLAGRRPPTVDGGGGEFVRFDLAAAEWPDLFRDGDVVHHFAWSSLPRTANDDPLGDLDQNLRGTLRLLEVLRRRQGVRLVFASSGGTVYGRLRRTPVDEDHPLEPLTAYGVSKAAAEKYCGFYRSLHGLDCRVARIGNPYGIGQDPARKQGAASIFLHKALAGEPIEIWGDGSVVRDYIHVQDVAAGLLALADAPLGRPDGLPVFNIGSGEGVSLRELVAVLEGLLGRELPVLYLPGRRFDVPVSVLDVSRAERVLGWRAGVGLAAGLTQLSRLRLDELRCSPATASNQVQQSKIRRPGPRLHVVAP